MTVTRLALDALVTAADTGARSITGHILTWDEIGTTSAGPARFAAGSLTAAADPSRIKLLVEHDPNRVVGYATDIRATDTGVDATFHVPAGADGDEVLASAASKRRDGLSVGVQIDAAAPGADGTLDITAAQWRETSIVALPAFATAQVQSVAASNPSYAVTNYGPPPVPRRVQAATTRAPGDIVHAAMAKMAAGFRAEGADGLIRAALSDIVLPASPQTVRDAMVHPQWVGELWQARNGGRRPLIDSIQRKPLTSIRVTGYRKVYPALGVGAYAGNKAAVPSTGTFTLTTESVDAQRAAGAHDVDRVFIDLGSFGDESFLSAYFEVQVDNYLEYTESVVAADLLAAATEYSDGTTVGADSVVDAITAAAAYLGGIGASLDFVKVSPDLYGEALAVKRTDAPWLFDGSASISDQTATVGGIRISSEPSLPAGTLLAGDRRCATYYEWSPAPLKVQAINIPNGGIDLGVFGYFALIVNDPRALLDVSVPSTPVVP